MSTGAIEETQPITEHDSLESEPNNLHRYYKTQPVQVRAYILNQRLKYTTICPPHTGFYCVLCNSPGKEQYFFCIPFHRVKDSRQALLGLSTLFLSTAPHEM